MNLKFWKRNKVNESKPRKSAKREWFDAVIFAVVAATFIRMFLIEAYAIPTGSMEKSLLIGDYLFVSKVSYGARTPITPLAFPLSHNTLPLINAKSYWDGIQLNYHRLPGLGEIKRQDVVVFNYPEGDTVVLETQETNSYYSLVREMGRFAVRNNPKFTIVHRPVDKRENYIKRCQAIPGDTLQIINAQVYVNGKPAETAQFGQTTYAITTDGTDLNPQTLKDLNIEYEQYGPNVYSFTMTSEQAKEIRRWPVIKSVKAEISPKGLYQADVFPHDKNFKWNQDNFGPLIVPKAGWTVKLDSTTLPLYKRAIEVYECNLVQQKAGKIYINGKMTDSYTFKMNYYWMMGDNRHNSLDSRYWGFVPDDHVVGKALFVWMSLDRNGSLLNKIRYGRLFSSIK